MQFLYNPSSMSKQEIKATFVGRENLIDEIISLIEHQPIGAGVQHVLTIAARGMGKTTILLMTQFAMEDKKLTKQWQPVKFAEESYGIYDLADFWLEVIYQLSAEIEDNKLYQSATELKTLYTENINLQEASLALIKDWCQKNKKRLVLLIDNFDIILEQINDERENARLRDVLMNDGTLMIIGTATTFFHEARDYDQPLYNFFKIYNLESMKYPQIEDILWQRAKFDQIPNFEDKLKTNINCNCLRVLEHFTSGNPRLVLMLYRVLVMSDISNIRQGLESLLDEVTPYYKAKVESLPAQQRKILDYIARISSKTSEGVTPTEIAEACRLTVNQVSSQLKRLSLLSYVRAANLRGRSSYYTLSESLYAIWYQMRFERDGQQRMQWLINILQALYSSEEFNIDIESTKLEAFFQKYFVVKGEILNKDRIELFSLNNHEEAIESYNKALSLDPNKQESWYFFCISYLFKFIRQVNDDVDLAKHYWNRAIESVKHITKHLEFNEQWQELLSIILLKLAESKHIKLAKELIIESSLEKEFFPLIRAIDYVLTGDKMLTEKLSPEIRDIVEKLIFRLHKVRPEKT